MKLELNWRFKTLESLEKNKWLSSEGKSRLIRRTPALRKIPLNEFEVEVLRLMISQNIGLEYLIPLALEKLRENILSEGDYYKGDLLIAFINCTPEFWNSHTQYKAEMSALIDNNLEQLNSENIKIQLGYVWETPSDK